MEMDEIKERIKQNTIETDNFFKLMQLFKKQDDFIKQSLNFLDNLRQNADNLSFKEEYNKQSQKQFISEIDRIKGALEYNCFVDIDFKLNMAILLVELPKTQREIFFMIGIKGFNIAQIARKRNRKPQTISNSLSQMFEYFLYGNNGKFNIAQKTIFKNADKSYRHDEVKEIQSLCANVPQNAEIIVKDLFDDFVLLDKNKQDKDRYIDKLFEMYCKRENKDIKPDDFYIL